MSQVSNCFAALISLGNVIKGARYGNGLTLSSSVDALAGQARNLVSCLTRFEDARQVAYGGRPDRMNTFAEALFFLQRRKCIFYAQLEQTNSLLGSVYSEIEQQAAGGGIAALELITLRSSGAGLELTARALISAVTTECQGCITVNGKSFEAEVLTAYASYIARQTEQTKISAQVLTFNWTGDTTTAGKWWAELDVPEQTMSYARGAAAIAALEENLGLEPVKQALTEITASGRSFSADRFFAALRRITGKTEETLRSLAATFNKPSVS